MAEHQTFWELEFKYSLHTDYYSSKPIIQFQLFNYSLVI